MTIQPIETRYAGCRFRSRLEARWAVFFDALGIRWEYEPQGFTFTTRFAERFNYLPDFHLPDLDTWVEVKGADEEMNKTHVECAAINLPGELLILGPIPRPSKHEWAWLSLSRFVDEHGDVLDYTAWDAWVGFDGSKSPATLRRCTETSTATNYQHDPELTWLEPVEDMTRATAAHAYEAARSARFEHGESGAPATAKTPEEAAAEAAPELGLLSVMLQHPEVIAQAGNLVESNAFSDKHCGLIFTVLINMQRRHLNVDALTAWGWLAQSGAKPGGRLHGLLKLLMEADDNETPVDPDDPTGVTFALKWMLEAVAARCGSKALSQAAQDFLAEHALTLEAWEARQARKKAAGETP